MIGCGRAKGDWKDYEEIINDFARIAQIGEDPYQVYLVKLPESEA